MALPHKNEKGYLKLSQAGSCPEIIGKREHTSELALLYLQYGISCQREPVGGSDEEKLRFEKDANQTQVQELLESYKNPKGS